MFDNKQIVETKDVAEAIRALVGLAIKPDQLSKKKVVDRNQKSYFIAPGIITRIVPKTFYNEQRTASSVVYLNGDTFDIDLTPEDLANELGITTE